MTAPGRMIRLALGAALLGAMASAQDAGPLPPACDTLRALPTDTVAGGPLDYQVTQDHAGAETLMSMCSALDADDLPVVTLLLRQNISDSAPQDPQAQRDAMLAALADTFGQDPGATFPEIGEAAMYVAGTGQLTVWHRTGRVMLILTANGPDPDAAQNLAEQIAQAIVARFP